MSDKHDDDLAHPDNSENVLTFTKRFDANADIQEMRNLVEVAPPKNIPYRCNHMKIAVDSHYRSLTCRICGAVVDAFDWVNSVTKGETKVDWELKSLRQEIKDHREGLEKLKREEVNCRARIKTAQFRFNDINMALHEAGEKILKVKGDK